MKRSEIIRRVNDGLNTHPHRIMPPARFQLGDDNCVAVAEALGVPVEPDEPALPYQVAAIWDVSRGDFTVRVRREVDGRVTDGPVVLHLDRVDGYEARLLLEAFGAYNESRRPKWTPSLRIDTTEHKP